MGEVGADPHQNIGEGRSINLIIHLFEMTRFEIHAEGIVVLRFGIEGIQYELRGDAGLMMEEGQGGFEIPRLGGIEIA